MRLLGKIPLTLLLAGLLLAVGACFNDFDGRNTVVVVLTMAAVLLVALTAWLWSGQRPAAE